MGGPVNHLRPAGLFAAAVAVALGASGCGIPVFDPTSNSGDEKPRETITVPAAPPPAPATVEEPPTASRQDVQRALRRGAAKAGSLGVRLSAAVSSSEWGRPAQVHGSDEFRMWSMAKAVTSVAALRAARSTGDVPAELRSSISGAIKGSENCRQRRTVLWLQEMTGGTDAAAEAVRAELERAGAGRFSISSQPAPPAQDCIAFLRGSSVPNALKPSLQLGTSTWSVESASRFALALAEGELGSPGREVFGVMQMPKRRSREQENPLDYTASIDWGAGRELGSLNPAYKAGWGGVEQQRFVAGQVVALSLGVGSFGVAVYGVPETQPPIDDPGKTQAPEAIEAALAELKPTLIGG